MWGRLNETRPVKHLAPASFLKALNIMSVADDDDDGALLPGFSLRNDFFEKASLDFDMK